jgi:hypothetical protein
MGSESRRRDRRRTVQFDALETRDVMSTLAASAVFAARHKPVPKTTGIHQVYGSLDGQMTQAGRRGQGTVTFTAAGPEAPLGTGTFNGKSRYKAALENGVIVGYDLLNGRATLVDSSGNKLIFQFTGAIYESGPGYAFSWNGTAVGGSGRFSKAAGTLAAYGTVSMATGQLTVLSYTVTLTRN